MIKYIIIAIILILSYGTFWGLMKAAGKKTPPMPEIKEEKSEERSKDN